MRYDPYNTPARRSLKMLALTLMGVTAAIVGVIVARFSNREGATAASAMVMSLLVGGSMCGGGVLHFLGYDEPLGRGLARLVLTAAILGLITLLVAIVLWFVYA